MTPQGEQLEAEGSRSAWVEIVAQIMLCFQWGAATTES
jgi:hypothetical protein